MPSKVDTDLDQEPAVVSTAPTKKSNMLSMSHFGQLPLVLALLIIIGLLGVWRPWRANSTSSGRTISVTGEATITADPDEYTFNPEYDIVSSDQQQALTDATSKTNEVVAQLKKLGVADNKIKTNTSGYGNDYYNPDNTTYYSYLTVTIDDKALAQKVQDYLLTTGPSGSVTPQADFSKAKEKQLTDKARDKATADARSKADQSAKNLGFKVGKVKSFQDEPDNNFVRPLTSGIANSLDDSASGSATQSAPIQQGQNDLTYQVTVTYYID